MFELTSTKRLMQVKATYTDKRTEVAKLVKDSGNDR
jgi:hypothetical protein